MAQDKQCRVACETLVTTGMAIIAGEITTDCWVDMPQIVRDTIRDIGYNNSGMGFDWETCAVITSIDKQSPDISQGVTPGEGLFEEQGAGDQGLMFGYACTETPVLMPMPIYYAHRITRRLAEVRKNGILDFLRPDGKAQVTVEYDGLKPVRVHTVVLSAQHDPDVTHDKLRADLIEAVILPSLPGEFRSGNICFHVNPTGRFVVGGPHGDCGLTGRKIIVDTYGGRARHGGGAFSGKDPTKVDRSAAYAVRYVAKNVVAAGLAELCEVHVSYAIGVSSPIAISVDTEGTNRIPEQRICQLIEETFDLTPAGIISSLDLRRPIYRRTSANGHFGHDGPEFTWEKTDKAQALREKAGL